MLFQGTNYYGGSNAVPSAAKMEEHKPPTFVDHLRARQRMLQEEVAEIERIIAGLPEKLGPDTENALSQLFHMAQEVARRGRNY